MLLGLNKPNNSFINKSFRENATIDPFEFIIIVRPKTFILKIKKYFVKEYELCIFFSDKILPKLKNI
jgi:hypothetical protein